MNFEANIDQTLLAVSSRLRAYSRSGRQSALAMILARSYLLAGQRWAGWVPWHGLATEALMAVFSWLTGEDADLETAKRRIEELGQEFDGFDVEDDASAEWQHAVDFATALARIAQEMPLDTVLELTIRDTLESTFNEIANEAALTAGRPVSHVEAARLVGTNAKWQRAVAWLSAL